MYVVLLHSSGYLGSSKQDDRTAAAYKIRGPEGRCCCEVRDGGTHGCEVSGRGGVAAHVSRSGEVALDSGAGRVGEDVSGLRGRRGRASSGEKRWRSRGWRATAGLSGTLAPSSGDSPDAFCFYEHKRYVSVNTRSGPYGART
jgi:hypothetical protein